MNKIERSLLTNITTELRGYDESKEVIEIDVNHGEKIHASRSDQNVMGPDLVDFSFCTNVKCIGLQNAIIYPLCCAESVQTQ